MSDITLHITLHGSNCNRLRHFIFLIFFAHYKHQCTNHFLCIAEISSYNNCFHISYQCAIMSEITLNITLNGSTVIHY